MNYLKVLFWVGIAVEAAVRAPFERSRGTAARTDRRVSRTEKLLLGLLSVGGFVLPLIYSVTPWLNFANYRLPRWMGRVGAVLVACAVFIFGRAHLDLKSNWSPSLEIYQGHTLVTNGIYRHIRHPMYASQWLLATAQILLLQNWIAGPAGVLAFLPLYLSRVPAEEKMMLETFGDQYRAYSETTGSVIPKF